MNTLQPSNRTWSYFINWDKVFNNVLDIEISLNTLNVIIGKENIEEVLKTLLQQQPTIARVFPILLANREDKFTILHEYNLSTFTYKYYDFSKVDTLTDSEIDDAIIFLKESGFLDLVKNKRIKNLVDYVIGTEAGMDTNGRKNRSGHTMEDIVEYFIDDICSRHGWRYLKEATAKTLKAEWNMDLPIDKSSRRLDFVIDIGNRVYLIETNFYGGGGSKLKSTAKEYQEMYKFWTTNDKFKFMWITDGLGWKSAHLPLRESFNELDYILNLDMLSNTILEDILVHNI